MTWDVIGQERAVATLRRAIEDEQQLAHAYLFAGPEQVGRATTARRFAQALNCTSENQRPCDDCRSCRLIAEEKHPDVEWLRPGGLCQQSEHKDHEGSRDLRICQVRRLEHVVSLTPFEGRFRVHIVDPAEALTREAANAFLKTLEEPPPQVVLILVTAREETLPETVRSRCRRVSFFGVPRKAIEEALRDRWGAEPEQAARLARLAEGRLGWAVSVLADDRPLIDHEQVLDDIEAVLSDSFDKRFSYAANLGRRYQRDPEAVHAALDSWRRWWRDVLLAAAGREELVADASRLDTLRSHAAQYGVRGAVRALRVVIDTRRYLDEHASPTLALEAMLLDLPAPAI